MYKILSGKYDTALIPRVNREHGSITRGNDLRLQKARVTYDLSKYYFTNRLLTFGTVYLTMLSCLIQLTRLNRGLINLGNIKMLFMILKPKFMELEVGVVIRYRISISISNCILEYKMRA